MESLIWRCPAESPGKELVWILMGNGDSTFVPPVSYFVGGALP